ncbi:hypothetical protein F3C99_11390 [Vitellibacter sp. q18]|nr:hypothetical protein [Aequorivita lutea]
MESNLSIKNFNLLTQHKQYDLVFTKGVFINCYLKGNTRYALYALFKFFVEVEYSVSKNILLNQVAFEDGKLL